MATVFWGVLVVSLAVALAVAGLILALRLMPLPLREAHNDTNATIFGALYVMYTLMVGFSALLVSEQYDTAQRTVESEAASVEQIHRLAEQFPEAKRREIQADAEAYAGTVIEEGWPLMEGGRLSPRAGALADDLRSGVMDFEPGTSGEQAVYSQALEAVRDLDEYRALRLLDAREGIPSILWVVMVVGGVVTVASTYLFGMKSPRMHVLMVAALTAVLVLILYTIHALEYPFDGIVQVSPEAFELVLDGITGDRGR